MNCIAVSYYIYTKSPPQLSHLSQRDTGFFDSVRMNVRVLCYQPSFHNCSHIAIFFKFVAATILFQ